MALNTNKHQKTKKDASVCLIGAFPPPIAGISVITEQVKRSLKNLDASTFSINLAPRTLDRSWQNILIRLTKVIIGLGKYFLYLCVTPNTNIYLAVSGGLGQLYDIFFVTLTRLFGKQIFMHHHSFAYVDKKRFLTNILFTIAGCDAVHIVLCGNMQYKLKYLYKSVKNSKVIDNLGIIHRKDVQNVAPKKKLKTIGFLSNIVFEKGIAEFFEVVEKLEGKKRQLTALIAGPFQNGAVEKFVHQRIDELNSTTYVGSKYGHEKVAFFNTIEVLLFPTKYLNEAEPLTILEAMSYGVPVIAWERGCIGNVIPPGTGLLITRGEDFVHKAAQQIEFWHEKPLKYQESSKLAREWFLNMQTIHSENFNKFLRNMLAIN